MQPPVQNHDTLTNFAANPAPYLEKLRKDGEPLVLTVPGEADVVVQDAESYRRSVEADARREAIAAIKKSLDDMAAGRVYPAREGVEALARKHQLPSVQNE